MNDTPSHELAGKAAIVTGSTSGIGLGIARVFAGAGMNVMINGLGDRDAIEKIRAGVAAGHGVQVLYSAADMTRPSEIAQMVADAEKAFGKLDVLVNNAGLERVTPLDNDGDDNEATFRRIVEVNVVGTFLMTRAAAIRMRTGGSIINTASMASFTAMPVSPAYCATKGGVLMLTKAMAVDLAQFGIRVNCINPGTIKTPLLDKYFDIIEDPQVRAAALKGFTGGNLIPRMGTPEEIGKLVCSLASDDSSFTTGASHMIDGGMTI